MIMSQILRRIQIYCTKLNKDDLFNTFKSDKRCTIGKTDNKKPNRHKYTSTRTQRDTKKPNKHSSLLHKNKNTQKQSTTPKRTFLIFFLAIGQY